MPFLWTSTSLSPGRKPHKCYSPSLGATAAPQPRSIVAGYVCHAYACLSSIFSHPPGPGVLHFAGLTLLGDKLAFCGSSRGRETSASITRSTVTSLSILRSAFSSVRTQESCACVQHECGKITDCLACGWSMPFHRWGGAYNFPGQPGYHPIQAKCHNLSSDVPRSSTRARARCTMRYGGEGPLSPVPASGRPMQRRGGPEAFHLLPAAR